MLLLNRASAQGGARSAPVVAAASFPDLNSAVAAATKASEAKGQTCDTAIVHAQQWKFNSPAVDQQQIASFDRPARSYGSLFHNIERDLHERVILVADTPAQVTAGTRAIVQQVEPCNAAVFYRLVDELADAIAFVRISMDGDLANVMTRQSAMPRKLIVWLKRHGVDARARRNRRRSLPK